MPHPQEIQNIRVNVSSIHKLIQKNHEQSDFVTENLSSVTPLLIRIFMGDNELEIKKLSFDSETKFDTWQQQSILQFFLEKTN